MFRRAFPVQYRACSPPNATRSQACRRSWQGQEVRPPLGHDPHVSAQQRLKRQLQSALCRTCRPPHLPAQTFHPSAQTLHPSAQTPAQKAFLPHASMIHVLSPACYPCSYLACLLGANQSHPTGPRPSCIEPPFPIRFHQKGRRCSRQQLLQRVPQQVTCDCSPTTTLPRSHVLSSIASALTARSLDAITAAGPLIVTCIRRLPSLIPLQVLP